MSILRGGDGSTLPAPLPREPGIVDDWDPGAPHFNHVGINLFVSDYRGYGLSSGTPTVSNMLRDSNTVYDGFKRIIENNGFKSSLFVMGRSLGGDPR